MGGMTLEQKVRSILAPDDIGDGPLGQCGGIPELKGSRFSSFECDLVDWGCIYGIAFGLARTEEPCETNESVAKRALDAARAARLDHHGGEGFAKRDIPAAIGGVVQEYVEAANLAPATVPPPMTDGLANAIERLEREAGSNQTVVS